MLLRIAFYLIVLLWLAACAGGAARQPLLELAEHQHRLDAIWPGYSPSERAFGGFRGEGEDVYLLWRGQPVPSGFEATEHPYLWHSPQAVEGLSGAFRMGFDLDGVAATLVRDLGNERGLVTLVHEDFHDYQSSAFQNSAGSTLGVPDTGSMPVDQLYAALAMETSLLLKLMQQDGPSDHETLSLYVALRLWREQQLPDEFRSTERQVETTEGTAVWVESQAMAVIRQQDGQAARRSIASYLRPWAEAVSEDSSAALITFRVYGSGAAIAEVLAETDPHDWQSALETRDSDLFELLLERYQWPQGHLDALAEQIVQSDTFQRQRTRFSRLASPQEKNQQALQQVQRANRWALTIRGLSDEGSKRMRDGSFSIRRFAELPDGRLLLVELDEYVSDSELFSLRVRGRPMLMAQNQAESPTITIYLRRAPRLQGDENRMQTGTRQLDAGELRASGLELRFSTPLELTLERLD